MAALRSLSFCLLAVGLLLPAAAFIKQRITAEAGQDVILPCGTGKEKEIRAVEWIRPDLDPDGVFLYRDGHFHPDRLHPSFRSRVDLQDRQMKNGDASLILKDVMIKDTGTYLCTVTQGAEGLEVISSIHLVVPPPGTREGGGKEGGDEEGGVSVGLIVGLLVHVLLFLLFLLFFLICGTKLSRRKLFSRQTLAKAPEPELDLESPLSHYQLKQRNQFLLSPLFRYPPEQQNQILECKLPAEPEPEPEPPTRTRAGRRASS